MFLPSRQEFLLVIAKQIKDEQGSRSLYYIAEHLGAAVLKKNETEIAFWKAIALHHHTMQEQPRRHEKVGTHCHS
ncbi:hypothetical protein FHT02_003292 [Sphingomonas xinjiangensis]|uniref:Uncharacterized protein n=1 Tax=Sphingomonas xinjiangensis TaxID=643568 RepID=A0A840YNT6_9SPHN|nr:hypothetical protein [Sphingomonas xinjiangensis]